MRWPLVVLGTALVLSGCSNSTSSPRAPTTHAPTTEISRPETLSAELSPTPTTSEPSIDYQGRSLKGLPDCDWQNLGLEINGQGLDRFSDDDETDIVRTHFVTENSTGADCVVRDAPMVALLDDSNQLMSPIFSETQSEENFPWVLPHGFSIHFYYVSPSVSSDSMCPQTADYAKHLTLTFDNGKVIDYPLRDVIYACLNATPRAETVMNMDLAQ
ncbi:hypothetical protein [Trueperella pyogenes]|uniref:hypothetical protein n=1 Tax=Trueperella pyogenes TaxID=1661 RepID=UPI00345DF775